MYVVLAFYLKVSKESQIGASYVRGSRGLVSYVDIQYVLIN